MAIVLFVISVAILLTSLCMYLRVLYECVREVKIVKKKNGLSSKLNNAPESSLSVSDDLTNIVTLRDSALHITKYKQAPGPLPWPVLGNLAVLGKYKTPFHAFTELAKEFGDVYALTLGSTRCLIVNNLDLIREVLNQNGKYFGGRPDFLRFHVLFGGDRNNSLALCDWSNLQQKRRNLARKHCSPRDASHFFQKMSDVGCSEMQELMAKLESSAAHGEEFAIKPILQKTCANMFCQYMCTTRFDYEDAEFGHIVSCFDEIFWEINQGYAVDFLPWLKPFYAKHMERIVYWSETIRKFILERIVDDREKHIDLEKPDADFTDALLKSLAEDGEVSRDTIIFMLEDFIGGHSAIGNLVMLSLGYVIRNPEVEKKIQEEIDSVLGDPTAYVTLNHIEQMPYTLATIYEVLRYSSSPIVPHVATEDVAISGYGVTKGTIVFINNFELNTSPKYWNEPEKFDPHRFVEEQVISTDPPRRAMRIKKNIPHFLPFSIGKRTCIGQNLVKGFGFIMLANILHKYHVSCSNLENIKTYPACVALPKDTFQLALTPRFPKNHNGD